MSNMQRMGRIKDITDDTHHRIFSQIYRSVERRITPRMGWSNKTNLHDVSGIVFHPDQRLIMEPGETFTCLMSWNPENRQGKTERPVIMQGTPYGVVVITYPMELKVGVPFSPFSNIEHCQVYASDNFWAAANRFAVLHPGMMVDMEGWKCHYGYRGKVLQRFVKYWLLTTHFHEEINQQAELDKLTSQAIGDGIALPVIEPKGEKAKEPRRTAVNMKANHNRRRQSARNAQNNVFPQEA